jgi:hypothetical protein
LQLKAYKNIVVKTLKFLVKCTIHSCFGKKCRFWKNRRKSGATPSPEIWETKFGMERFINGFLDLITIWFLSRFGKRPMHLFGAMGSLMFIIGFFI